MKAPPFLVAVAMLVGLTTSSQANPIVGVGISLVSSLGLNSGVAWLSPMGHF